MDNDIIIIGQQPWDTEIGSNCKNIALELSKTNRVLYINSPLDRITLIKNKKEPKIQRRINVIKHKEDGLVNIKDNLWNYYPDCIVESINWISSTSIFRLLNKRNNKKLSKSIQKAIESLKFKNVVLFNDNEMFKAFYLQDYLKPFISVYYSRDYMIGVDYWKKHGETLEPELIAKSDLCVANSEYLAAYCRKYNPKSFNIGQGCDIESFKNVGTAIPEVLKDIKTKIIGYVGALSTSRLNIEIIQHIANQYPYYNVVLVGPEDDSFINSELHNIKNVIFIGQREVDELPLFINAFDICINPQTVNAITRGNYPRKIDEYLALGKPVIATRTETMEVFKDFVYLADTKEDYVALIEKAFIEHNKELESARKEFAFSHTWENSVKTMTIEIDKLINNK
ncbi:glycosyltransferase [Pedobacter jamesrossensis]|uniref:Glycosyltransferase n=1 Tax=Pedobacter jamesrossensis TaxID=1908238 RepID=A0ABV8NDQ4_9SPHI